MITVLILSTILTVALGSSSLIISGTQIGRYQSKSIIAYYASEAGVERVLWETRKNGAQLDVCDTNVVLPDRVQVHFGANPADCVTSSDMSSYTYILPPASSYNLVIASTSPEVQIKSTGTYKDVVRTVEVVYNASGI